MHSPSRLLFLALMPVCMVSRAVDAQQADAPAIGIEAKRPVLGAACKTCPWGALADIVKEMLVPYGYDVQICYHCWGANAPRIVSEGRKPPERPDGIPRRIPAAQIPEAPDAPVEFGVTSVRNLYRAYHGIRTFEGEGPRDNLRLFGVIQQPSYIMVAVKTELGITSLGQLKEKRWPVRILGSTRGPDLEIILAHYGLSVEAIEDAGGAIERPSNQEAQENFDLIIDDGSLGNAPEFNHWYALTQKYDLTFLELPDEVLDRLAENPEYERVNIPWGLLRGVDRPIPTVARSGHAVYGRADTPAGFAYDVARAMDEQQHLLQWGHINFSYNIRTVWKALDVPLHPGAERYYRERNYMK